MTSRAITPENILRRDKKISLILEITIQYASLLNFDIF